MTSKSDTRKQHADEQGSLQPADENAPHHEPMRRDHFPVEKGENQQDDDYLAEESNPSGLAESNVKWPEVDSQEALDAKIDEAQTDKDKRIIETARDADREANDR